MASIKWIKICTDIFDDEKILLIENMPEADSIIVIWFKLLCMAGKQNNSGVFILNDKIAYTDEMLATIFRRPINTVRLALSTFEEFGMIEVINGAITIPNWEKHQSLDKIEAAKERGRQRVADYRARQRAIASSNASVTQCNGYSNVTVTQCNAVDKDKDKDKELEGDVIEPKGSCCTKDVQRIIDEWNTLNLSCIRDIRTGSNRHKLLSKRIKDYGTETIIEAIGKIRNSSFLQGQSKSGWIITFDWFIKPNNFIKVLEGNYDDRSSQSTPMNDLAALHNMFSEEENDE